MWKLLKPLIFSDTPAFNNDMARTIQRLVAFNGLNKRKNLRIQYPEFGACAPYPRIFHKGREIQVKNISVGGVLVHDPDNAFGTGVGESITLTLRWSNEQYEVRARIVGVQLDKRNIQFMEFNAKPFLKISQLTRAAYWGNRFRKVEDNNSQLNVNELWIGPAGESLIFPQNGHLAEYTAGHQKIIFTNGNPAVLRNDDQPVDDLTLQNLLVTFSNISNPSKHIQQLIEYVGKHV